ncbi:hypothetical protein PSTG_11223 [Puccinia striiformis f. sp. tritici PST-78]|uniref:Tc1-like transposase DDE domain-containing protein n=1 Tax=Puccinia striiformis f. sp. tritici PST-78 TaxID=1165861 RepID=A0A0L0V8A4_9BASI|nr:hypothetical protein PSTG_11223 [Puccinia striiformis f. sp. tritici PST-78]
MKDPMALHRSIHTSVELLKFNGENFIAWQQQLDTTLDFVFLTDRFSEKAHWNKLSAEHEPSVTLLLRGSVEPLLFKSVRNARKPADIYRTLKTRCKRSDRQRKITIVNKLKDFYAYEQQESNAELIAQIQDFFLEVSQQNLSIDELLGLVLQSVAKPPIGVDENVFRNNLNHRLNSTTPAPLLDTVCQELAQVEGELHTGTSTNPILINRLQPGGTNHSKSKNTSSGGNTSTFGHKAFTNALAFQGQQPSTALMAAKGDTCKYCEIKGHWALTCWKFARDLRNGKINVAQLAEYAKDPQFKLNPSFVKVRAVDLNATPDDTVLVDSGASACIPPEYLVFTDEAGISKDTHRRKDAWARVGRRSRRILRTHDTRRVTVIPAVSLDGLVCSVAQPGSITRLDFEFFLEEVLIPCMSPYPGRNSVLVMDNARIHHGGRIQEICEANQIVLIYLSPYSPDFNPIEKVFSVLKSRLKRAQILTGTWEDAEIIKDFLPTFVCPDLM